MTSPQSRLAALPVSAEESTRVCGITFTAREDHLLRSLSAWKRREHPAWSQYAVTWRVTGGAKIRRVK